MHFNKEQLDIINFKDGNCTVLAGAGSGKSTCLVNRIKTMVNSGISINDITAITFTKNSSTDLKGKLKKIGVEGVRVGTFHAIGYRILMSDTNSGFASKSMTNPFTIDGLFKKINYNKKANTKDILSFISFQKNNLVGVSDDFIDKESEYEEGELREFYRQYEQIKKSQNWYDLDDLLVMTYELLKKDRTNKYTSKYLLVDEAQDNNLINNKLMKLLCPYGNIMLIGDFRQSIYSFRGSRPEDFMDFDGMLDNCSVISLDTNYRSKSNIVDNANGFMKQYYGEYKHYSDSIANIKTNGNINILDSTDDDKEAINIVRDIKKLIDSGCNPNDICVLYRLNSQIQKIENQLKIKKIGYDIHSSDSFFNRKEIDLIMCVLRLINDPRDDMAYEKLFQYRAVNQFLPNKVLDSIVKTSALYNISYLEASEIVKVDFKHVKMLKSFSDIMSNLIRKHKSNLDFEKLVESILLLMGINDFIEMNYKSKEEIEERMKSIDNFKKFIKNNTLESFLIFVYEKNNTQKKVNDNKVQLMTIHKSKGLEFKNVFVIGINDEKFPNKRASIEDEARLMYVAITRAKDNLWLSTSEDSMFISQYTNRM